jgi:hypothetical protein
MEVRSSGESTLFGEAETPVSAFANGSNGVTRLTTV